MSESDPAPSKGGGISAAGWSAIAAIAVALIGAIVTLTTTWWSHPAPKAPPQAAGVASAP